MKTTFPLFRRVLLLIAWGSCLTAAKAQYVSIPDPNFASWLYNNGYASCVNLSTGWWLNTACAAGATDTAMDCSGYNISDLTGVEYFTNLKLLNCSNNQLTTLPNLPPSLQYLNCSHNNISSIPDLALPYSTTDFDCSGNDLDSLPILPSGLTSLNCSLNNLTHLPDLPNTIAGLDVSYNLIDSLPTPLPGQLLNFFCESNHIHSLPALPSGIANLDCSFNMLTALPSLPSLSNLNCSNNSITSLPSLPTYLITLDCGHNPIHSLPALPTYMFSSLKLAYDTVSSLPALPSILGTLDCSYCNLGTLPALPTGLFLLHCEGNDLTTLPMLPSRLQYLYCAHNRLTALPSLPATLVDIRCNNNPGLSCLPYIRSNFLYYFYISGTSITCLPNRFSLIYYSDVTLATYPLCDPASGCNFYYNILGNVHYDNSASCALDSIAQGPAITNMKLLLKQGSNVIQQFYTFSSGDYSFKTPSYGTFTVELDTTAVPVSSICPQNGQRNVTISAVDSVKKYENFGMQCSGTDCGVNSIETSRCRPGTQSYISIDAGDLALQRYNANCSNGAGIVSIILDPYLHFVSAAPGALTPTSISGDTLNYSVASMNGLASGSFNVIVLTDIAAPIGAQACITTTVATAQADAFLANNSLTQCFKIVNSLDPNLKEVYPDTLKDNNTDWLTYTIHFQNTGSDTAYLVVLKDTLSQYVDAASFQYLASSHHAVIQLDHNAMTFTFPHINLVDSATNPPLSEGWIQYRVKANAGLPNGTAINNTAYIYFDLNPAVVTNTATTTVQLVTCSDTTTYQQQQICAGQTYTFHGRTLDTTGIYADTLTSAGGCDSIISLALTVQPVYWHFEYDTICAGDVYMWAGHPVMAAGSYDDSLHTAYGCDSISTLRLYVRPAPVVTLTWDSLYQLHYLRLFDGHASWWQWCNPYIFPAQGGSPAGGTYLGRYLHNDTFDFSSIVYVYHDIDTITYIYTDIYGCVSSAVDSILLTFCEGINDLSALSPIHLYPDPNTGTFTLQTERSYGLGYRISDILGKEILQGTITTDTQPVRLPDVADGVYTIAVDGARPLRFVVVR